MDKSVKNIENLDPHQYIIIKGARVHNLKNLSVAIPRNKLVVVTGLSGSGKSSLAFDTLYAEGQRRYVESLSSYARQFLGRMSKPEVDYIKGIAPAIAIEQKINSRNPRSTVGTSTEIYEYLKLLFARIGKTYSPVSGQQVMRHKVSDVIDYLTKLKNNTKILVCCPIENNKGRSIKNHLQILLQQGFTRIFVADEMLRIDELIEKGWRNDQNGEINLVIDRVQLNNDDDDLISRLADSTQLAFNEGHGYCNVFIYCKDSLEKKEFSNKFELDGMKFEKPTQNLFSFNNPFGACKKCEGFGNTIGIDEDLVIPNKSLSIYDDAVACWKGEKMSEWKDILLLNAYKFNFPIHKAFYELNSDEKELLWAGNQHFAGLNDFFEYVENNTYKIQYRVMLSRYRGKTICPECKGTRLRKDANYVKVDKKSISDLVLMPLDQLVIYFQNIKLSKKEKQIASRLLKEIQNRLGFLSDVGLGYLTLNRLSSSLSGGESQRINLATSLGSSLVGSMYILDEPSIGLHPRDTHRLIHVLKQLRDLGNTVIVVEHDESIIKAADEIIDIGPLAGSNGGELIFQGPYKELIRDVDSLTSAYLSKRTEIELPKKRRIWNDFIKIEGARENNLKGIEVKFPLKTLTLVTGVSGSGKTTLIKKILYTALKKIHGGYGERTGKFDKLSGDYDRVRNIELVDQNPIGRSSRSNPSTYVKAYDDIRQLYADEKISRLRGYKPGFFSFNVPGGRCEECEGEGRVKIEMQFMADIHLTCESCGGKRFKNEVLDVTYKGKTISDILDLTINQAIELFESSEKLSAIEKRIVNKLKPLQEVGLGYLKMGQSSSTLSGGEAQRTKLAFFLSKGSNDTPTLFIFDEPTTGLHFHDINKLLHSFDRLLEKNHSIIVIEHNMDVVKCADWIIDLGPDGGDDGGEVIFEGTPEDLCQSKKSFTATFLKEKLYSSEKS